MCCGVHRHNSLTPKERLEQLKNYTTNLQKHKCEYCGGSLKWFPGGIIICTTCRRRKN